MVSQIKDRKHFEQNFHSVAGIMLQGWDLGCWGGGGGGGGGGVKKNFNTGICDGAPSTSHSSYNLSISVILYPGHGTKIWLL